VPLLLRSLIRFPRAVRIQTQVGHPLLGLQQMDLHRKAQTSKRYKCLELPVYGSNLLTLNRGQVRRLAIAILTSKSPWQEAMQLRGQAEAEVFVVAFGNSQIEQGVAGAAAAIAAVDEGATTAVLGSRQQVAAVLPVGPGAAAMVSQGLLGKVAMAALKGLVVRVQQTRKR
jgi:hypothetical protein